MVAWEALDALSRQLELCGVDADTRLVVLIDPTIESQQIAEIQIAVERSAARSIQVRVSPNRCDDNEPLAAAVAASDLVVTTGHHRTVRFPDRPTLYLHPMAPDQFAPHASLRRRVHSLRDAIETATTLTMTDTNGTDMAVSLHAAQVTLDHGFVADDHPGACFPAGWVTVVPAASTVHGKLVLMPGDGNLGARQRINSPVVLHLGDDHISAIEGESPDADIVRALLEHPDQPSAYGFASLNVGLNPGRRETGAFDDRMLDPVVSQLLAGVVQVAFGENLVADRPCRQTITMALRGRTIYLDELPVVVRGRLDGDIAPDVYEL